MKLLKYLLLFLFAVILIGISGKTVTPFTYAGLILFFSMIGYFVGGMIYIILTLVNEKHRIEAAMIGISFPFVVGLFFTCMRWPFGGPLIVVGSSVMLMLSIGLFIYVLVQNRNVLLGALYAATGLSSLYFCFKIMLWPGSFPLFIFAVTGVLATIIFLFVKKQKLTSAVVLLLILNGCIFVTVFASKSQLYCYKHLNTLKPEINFPENYYTYAWMLYQEGKTEEAKANLKLAMQEAKNPKNIRAHESGEQPEETIQRYQRAMDLLNANNWTEKEISINARYQ
jgi:glucan phosphoethanolaminetransferase (alkaline phosphatase superfamily)